MLGRGRKVVIPAAAPGSDGPRRPSRTISTTPPERTRRRTEVQGWGTSGSHPAGLGPAGSRLTQARTASGFDAPGLGRTKFLYKRGLLQAALGLTAAVLFVLGIQAQQP